MGSSLNGTGITFSDATAQVTALNSVNAKTPSSGAINGVITSGTAVSASGTAVDFTGIPSWAKRITVMFSGVSTNGTAIMGFQLGSGGISTTGYTGTGAQLLNAGTVTVVSQTTLFAIQSGSTAAVTVHGTAFFNLLSSSTNTWAYSSVMARTEVAGLILGSGSKSLSGALDTLRVTTVGGASSYDAGTINILYE